MAKIADPVGLGLGAAFIVSTLIVWMVDIVKMFNDFTLGAKLPPEIRAKMWLSHYQDFVLTGRDMFGNSNNWHDTLVEDGFAGLVFVGQVFEI